MILQKKVDNLDKLFFCVLEVLHDFTMQLLKKFGSSVLKEQCTFYIFSSEFFWGEKLIWKFF